MRAAGLEACGLACILEIERLSNSSQDSSRAYGFQSGGDSETLCRDFVPCDMRGLYFV